MIYVDNSKAEEYALYTFFCQWICANKRRCMATLRYVVMAQDSTSLSLVNTAFRQKNRRPAAVFFSLKGQHDEIITAFCFAGTIAG